jgi:hypothetical protein
VGYDNMERSAVCALMRAASTSSSSLSSVISVAGVCAAQRSSPSTSLVDLQHGDGYFELSAALLAHVDIDFAALQTEVLALNGDQSPSSLLWRVIATALALVALKRLGASAAITRAQMWLTRIEAQHGQRVACRFGFGSRSWVPVVSAFLNSR